MSQRLVEVSVPDSEALRVQGVIEEFELEWSTAQSIVDTTCFRLLVDAEAVEGLLDSLSSVLSGVEGHRVLVLKIEASLPAQPKPEVDPTPAPEAAALPARLSRQELHAEISSSTRISRAFLANVVLSVIVAAVGLVKDSPAIVIGAMVIAPLLGPNLALILATTLGDGDLAKRALRQGGLGLALAVVVGLVMGTIYAGDLETPEVLSRTTLDFGDLLLALAAGTAGAVAVTSGIASSLVGVMVAVALVPPLVAGCMLLVAGEPAAAWSALLLTAINLICINLAGVATFLIRGIRPHTFWEARRSRRATRLALALWVILLAVAAVLLHFGRALS